MSKFLMIIKQIVAAAGQTHAFEHDDHFHLRLEHPVYMPLVIESWETEEPYCGEKRVVSVAHYFKQEGDLIADPEVLITDHGDPIHLQQVLCFTRVMRLGPRGTVCNDRARRSVEELLRIWALNLREQGWIETAASYKNEPAAGA